MPKRSQPVTYYEVLQFLNDKEHKYADGFFPVRLLSIRLLLAWKYRFVYFTSKCKVFTKNCARFSQSTV